MTHHLIIGFNDQIGPVFHARIPWLGSYRPGRAQFVGVATGSNSDDTLLAVVMFSEYVPPSLFGSKIWGGTCQVGIAALSPRWAVRGTITRLLSIPFLEYKVRKLVTVVPSTNMRSKRLSEGLGFKPEGTLRHHYADGVHAVVSGMMRKEFEAKWLRRTRKPRATDTSHARPIQLPGGAVAH